MDEGNGGTYTGPAKALHWLVVALFIIQFAIAWTMPDITRNTPPTTLISLHFSVGVLIFLVVVIRLIWRASHPALKPEKGAPAWQTTSARMVHGLLYLLLLALPVLGWVNASWRGMPISFFGLFVVPGNIAMRAPGWAWTGDIYALLANYALLALVGVHVAAALYHRFVLHDRVMQRMLPYI